MTAEPTITGREQKNFRIPYHILHAFFSQPAPIYQGA
jgi:hypothetical protein